MSGIRSERLVTLDVLRGLAIIVMVFLHNGAFHFSGLAEALESPPPWLVAFGFLLLWAGLFGVVSGAANATTALRRLERQQASGESWRYPPSLVGGALQTFAILFVLHWVWTVGVGNSPVTTDPDDPSLRVTLVPGLMYFGFFPRIHPESWVFASALWMIGANVLGVSLALRWIYRREPPRAGDGLERKLALLAGLVLLATPVLRTLLFEPMMERVARGGAFDILAAIPSALLVNDPNPVFPFFAYGLFGAVVGAALARGEPRGPLNRRMGAAGALLLALGGLGLWLSGGVVLAEREEIWGQSALYFTSLCYLLLGLFAWLVILVVALFDPPEAVGWRPRWLPSVLRFGRLSLTVFMLEGILAMAVRMALDAAAPGWNASLGAVFAFALANLVLWHFGLLAWERFEYRGSLEWWLARIRSTDSRSGALRGAGAAERGPGRS